MSDFEEDKFIVINRKRLEEMKSIDSDKWRKKYAKNAAQHLEDALRLFNNSYKEFVGKKLDQKYYVCNQDEPYAQEVIDCILNNRK